MSLGLILVLAGAMYAAQAGPPAPPAQPPLPAPSQPPPGNAIVAPPGGSSAPSSTGQTNVMVVVQPPDPELLQQTFKGFIVSGVSVLDDGLINIGNRIIRSHLRKPQSAA